MKLNKLLTIIVIFGFFVSGCNSVKQTLSGEKKQNSDEFLVKKKNPLVLPPNFDDLPEPQEKNNENENENKNIDLSKVLSEKKNEDNEEKKKNNSLEKSISEILKNN
tara:strand:+ start:20 stop:340 length:321 start_codon:yes stop_codon:yes gene_type:complete